MNEFTTPQSLYGNEAPPPVLKGPSLLDQVTGIFTEPVALFRRLEATPVWAGALGLLTALNVVLSVLWARKVDVDAMMRPALERNPKISPDSYDAIIALQSRVMVPASAVIGLVVLALFSLVLALIFWGMGKWTAENRPPSYQQAFSATAVSSLVNLPKYLILGIVCVLRNIGGARLEALSPTALGFYFVPDGLKLHALFNSLDLFTFASMLMLYLAARHTLRLKVSGALLCVAVVALFTIGLPVLGAR